MNKSEIIDLDTCLINALNLFINNGVPSLEVLNFKRPIVLGSGNAFATGKVLFDDYDAVFADESNFIQKLNKTPSIDGAVLISASGGKHAPIIATELKSRNIETVLITNTKNSPTEELVSKTYVLAKNPEPYTYNTSTYLGMILAKTKEQPQQILETIDNIKDLIPKDLNKYNAFYIIIPNEFESIREMFLTKFSELFGSRVIGRVYTPDQTKHAKTLVPSDTELFISIGYENNTFGDNRLNIPLPEKYNYGMIMALGYYIIGQIQKSNPQYFKENIDSYIEKASKMFNEKLSVIVE